jgi:hypothetical protein
VRRIRQIIRATVRPVPNRESTDGGQVVVYCVDCAITLDIEAAAEKGLRHVPRRLSDNFTPFYRICEEAGWRVAAKQATSVIPIVFVVAADPVGSVLVASLARPGGNITGLSLRQTDVGGKRLELLREAFPGLRRLAIMANVSYPAAEHPGTAPGRPEIMRCHDYNSCSSIKATTEPPRGQRCLLHR